MSARNPPCFGRVAIPLGQGQVFNADAIEKSIFAVSQSLWVRDRFLIKSKNLWQGPDNVAIPLGQGQVFNVSLIRMPRMLRVAIPLGQGQVFNLTEALKKEEISSQSLWVRDRFLITVCGFTRRRTPVAIPLGQGQVFNL